MFSRVFAVSCYLFGLLFSIATGIGTNPDPKEQELLQEILKATQPKNVRPRNKDWNLDATVVQVDIHMRTLDFIHTDKMEYGIQFTFRQRWFDPDLEFPKSFRAKNIKYLTITNSSLVWIPDTHFLGEKNAKIHDLITPNKFIRLYPDGGVLYSARISTKVHCHMNLKLFPFDTQICSLQLASYAYPKDKLIYHWLPSNAVQHVEDLSLPEFTVQSVTTKELDLQENGEIFSSLHLEFHLVRDARFYSSQIFLPCLMLMLLSVMSLWIDKQEAGARIVALMGSMFSTALFLASFMSSLPKVSYIKLVDLWTGSCTLFGFSAVVAYVFVHHFDGGEKETFSMSLSLTKIVADLKGMSFSHVLEVGFRAAFILGIVLLNLVFWVTALCV